LSFIIEKKNNAPKVNKIYVVKRNGRWLSKTLEEAIKVIERGNSLSKVIISWNILMFSLSDYLNGNNV
jgi:hypothetical protein